VGFDHTSARVCKKLGKFFDPKPSHRETVDFKTGFAPR
jgi:hypothetical protein